MTEQKGKILPLSEMIPHQEGIFFAVLSGKTTEKTRKGVPFIRLLFRDARREVQTLIWQDSPFYSACEKDWNVGDFFKIAGVYQTTEYGPRIDLRRIRLAVEADTQDGFSPNLCRPMSRIEPVVMYDELLSIARERIGKSPLLLLVQRIFKEHRHQILDAPSSRRHHHPYFGGMLEHTLSVTKIALGLADHYAEYYRTAGPVIPATSRIASASEGGISPVLSGGKAKSTVTGTSVPFSIPLVAAGAILHEIGKIDEMEAEVMSPRHSLSGELLGYPVLGRDRLREYAPRVGLDASTQTALEHILLSHPRFPEWGSVGVPATLEAILVHQADYADSIFASALRVLASDHSETPFTTAKGPFGAAIWKSFPVPEEKSPRTVEKPTRTD